MIRFDEIEDKTKWNEFLSQNGGSFTESWEWGEVQRKEGGKVSRFFICEGNEILGAVAIYVKRTPAGSYGYIPRGPAIGERVFDRNEWEEFRKLLHDFSKAKGLIFLLWEPLKDGEFGDLKKTKGRQPAKTILINLSKSLEDLLRDINKTKRYGISVEELEIEFKKRARLLYNMYTKKIFDYEEVQKIVTEYYKKPDDVLRRFGVQ